MQVTVKAALDHLFQDTKFDKNFHKKIVKNNIEYITRNTEYKQLFGSRLIGSHMVKYTMYDKDIFYNNLFGLSYTEVSSGVEKITTINKNFKVARDDVNLVCMYIAHKFLINKDLKKEDAIKYASDILDYFSYRTLVLISSNYFTYPISEEKALTLVEKLSNKYIIKKVKNWNEYCKYRSTEFLASKFLASLISFNNDEELPNLIADLFNRTKDTIKNIYKEFIDMSENDNIIKSKKNVINDVDGQEVIVDRLDTPEKYFTKVENMLSDKSIFIKKEYINVVVDIISTISYSQISDTLTYVADYAFTNRDNNNKVTLFIKDILINAIEYLRFNDIFLHAKTDALTVINVIVGNVLYARGSDIKINKVKEDGDKLIKELYKFYKVPVTERNVKNIRNGIFIYVVLLGIIDN